MRVSSDMSRVTEKQLECIAAAVLAVNAYPLERAQRLLPALRALGLLAPEQARAMSLERVIAGLEQAGYARGKLTWMVAERLQGVMEACATGRLDGLVDALERDDRAEGERLLDDVRGIGPHVASSAWALMRLL